MEEIQLEVQIREKTGKSGSRKVRQEDAIPAIVYGEKEDPTPIKVDRRTFERIERQHQGESVLIRLNLMQDGKKVKDYATLIKEVQVNPVTDKIIHVDFQRVNLTEEIEVKVPIHAKGEPVGVKKDGGSLDHILWELDVICLPTNIPQHLDIDVTHLGIHDSIHVKDILLPEGVRTEHDPEAIVFTVVPPAKEEVEEAAAEEEGAEPEVIREKKPEKEAPEEKAEKKEESSE